MLCSRLFFEALFEAVRQEILRLTNKQLDIYENNYPASTALGNNLPARELLKQIESRMQLKDREARLAYDEDFKAAHYINLHPDVESLAGKNDRLYFNFGRRLYVKMRALKDDEHLQEVDIQEEVEIEALCRFVGLADIAAFCTKYGVPLPVKNSPRGKKGRAGQKKEAGKPKSIPKETPVEIFSFQVEEGFYYFLFCYFSERSNRVNKALVSIKKGEQKGPWEAWQYGFHQPDDVPNFHSISFRGEAKIWGRRLYLNLESGYDLGQPMQMNFIGLLKEPLAKLDSQQSIPCSLQTVSVHAPHTIATEGYLLPCSLQEALDIFQNPEQKLMASGIPLQTRENGLSEEQKENLLLYLTMNRKHFRLELNKDSEPMSDLDSLAIRQFAVTTFRERLRESTWILLNFGLERSTLLVSKLTIGIDGEPFRARFYPYIDTRIQGRLVKEMISQKATLSISDEIRHEQLCVTTYSPKGDLMNMTCFDFSGLNEGDIADGIFLSVGYDQLNKNNQFKTSGPIGGYVVMRKQQPGEPDFEAEKIKPDDVEEYVKKHNLGEMLKRLRLLWKRKTHKKLINLRLGAFAVCTNERGILLIENMNQPYGGRFHLPGALLKKPGQSLEEVLQQSFKTQTGIDLDVGQLRLWQNEKDIFKFVHDQNVREDIHLVGALYKVDGVPATLTGGNFIDPRGVGKEMFTPFAWLAVQDYLKNNPASQ